VVSPALEPRATRPGETCSPPLLCAWSIDAIQTRLPSTRLYLQAAAAGKNAAARGVAGITDEQRYDELTSLYEKADPDFLRSTGIVHLGSTLPEHIHVIPFGGEQYFHRALRDADMIMDGLLRATSSSDEGKGLEPADGEQWIDFGGSHGRVAQILAAAYPGAKWHVCDPISETVEWARARLPRLHFHTMGQKPPLSPYGDGTFAGAYALSIWSHYSEEAALVWFDEMWRILSPGGRLWFSTHGHQAINFAMLDKAVVHDLREEMFRDLYLKGHYYFPMFGSRGDWGVSDGTSDGSWWGYGAFTAEWLAAKVLNSKSGRRWRLEYYGPGANEKHQDVYVLSKVAPPQGS
jgi:SAM-dependent methyltransferase